MGHHILHYCETAQKKLIEKTKTPKKWKNSKHKRKKKCEMHKKHENMKSVFILNLNICLKNVFVLCNANFTFLFDYNIQLLRYLLFI